MTSLIKRINCFLGCKVSPEMYGHMTHWLSSLANGRIILSLEGGYNINSIAYSMTMCTKSLLGDPLIQLEANLTPSPSAVNTIKNVIKVHEKYWSNLAFMKLLPQENVLPVAKVPRAKPTERLSARNDCLSSPPPPTTSSSSSFCSPKIDLDEERKKAERREEKVLEVHLLKLEKDLDDLKIKECVNQDKEKKSNLDKNSHAANPGSSSGGGSADDNAAAAAGASSSQNTGGSTLLSYLQDNLQVRL